MTDRASTLDCGAKKALVAEVDLMSGFRRRRLRLYAAAVASGIAFSAIAQPLATDERLLEQNLLLAMRWARGSTERLYNSDVPILAYAKQGFVPLKPDAREDYVDYRRFRKPAHFLGSTLVTLEEEYMTKYIGCCVNAGIGAVAKLDADVGPLKRFASENACSIEEDAQRVAERLKSAKAKMEPGARYVAINCRERDAAAEKLASTQGEGNRVAKVLCIGALKEAADGKTLELGDECRASLGSAAASQLREACGASGCVVEANAIVKPEGPLIVDKVVSVPRAAPGEKP